MRVSVGRGFDSLSRLIIWLFYGWRFSLQLREILQKKKLQIKLFFTRISKHLEVAYGNDGSIVEVKVWIWRPYPSGSTDTPSLLDRHSRYWDLPVMDNATPDWFQVVRHTHKTCCYEVATLIRSSARNRGGSNSRLKPHSLLAPALASDDSALKLKMAVTKQRTCCMHLI